MAVIVVMTVIRVNPVMKVIPAMGNGSVCHCMIACFSVTDAVIPVMAVFPICFAEM